MRRLLKRLRDVLREQIFVLLRKACNVVNHFASVMVDLELGRIKLGSLTVMWVLVLFEVELMHSAK